MIAAGHSDEALPLRPEVELLLCCARLRPDDEITARIRSLVQSKPDWDALLRLAERHRVVPLLFRQLQAACPATAVPPAILARLQNHFYLSALRNDRLSRELCEILKLFSQQRIPVIPYKGPALALSLYGDLALRQFGDLDLLIHRADVPQASELLHSIGYRKQHQLTRAQEAAFQRSECEHLFYRDHSEQLYLDLHWEFVPRYFSLKLDPEIFWPRLEETDFEGLSILSFKPEDLLLILCVHAAKESWERLVWLCDIRELVNAHPHLNWQQLIEQASAVGALRILLVSLALAHDLLATTLPPEIAQAIESDRTVQTLTTQLKQQLLQETAGPAGISRFLLPGRVLERWRDRLSFHLRLALTPSPEDWAFVPLPDHLLPLYFLIRPLRLARKYLLRR